MSEIDVAPSGPEHAPGLVALFEACGCPCYCRYWHFSGDSNAWLDRCANAPATSRAELERALANGSDEGRGVVAFARGSGRLVGWLKVAPARIMAKAYARRPYRGLPCFDREPAGVFVVGCALVHPEHRRRGVAIALVDGAVAIAPSWGARCLEAFPRKLEARAMDEELWTGPLGAFTKSGFREIDAVGPYPVLRRELPPRSPEMA